MPCPFLGEFQKKQKSVGQPWTWLWSSSWMAGMDQSSLWQEPSLYISRGSEVWGEAGACRGLGALPRPHFMSSTVLQTLPDIPQWPVSIPVAESQSLELQPQNCWPALSREVTVTPFSFEWSRGPWFFGHEDWARGERRGRKISGLELVHCYLEFTHYFVDYVS